MHFIRRRDIMRGLGLGAGAAMLAPLARSLVREARAELPLPKRLVVVTNGNGFRRQHYSAVEGGGPTSFSLGSVDLGPVYAPLEPHKDALVVLEQFYNPHDRALHGNQWATLSMQPSPDQSGEKRGPPGGISIDRLIASEVGSSDPFSSIAVGIEEGPGKVLCVSADGLDQPFPAYGSPVQAYSAYFGELTDPGGLLAADKLSRDQSLLDHIRGDAARLEGALAGPERAKLEQFQDSLFSLEDRLSSLYAVQASCEDNQPPSDDLDRANLDPAVVQAHGEVVFNALMCGLTHVAHISILGMEGPHNRYGWLGDTKGHHNLHHDGDLDIIEQIDAFVLSQLADMRQRLAQVPEGDGTMADQTLIMYVNTCGGKHHGGQDSHAIVLLGGAGYFETGRYLAFPEMEHSMADVFVSVANAMGVEIETFGTPEHCKGPLPGLV
ncbi:MAG: DUF1552 domain-containing protein [Myxococcota bacterium]